jgi:predicted ATPase
LLVEASDRCQLIVTTHSDVLVSALSEQAESVLVCERDEDGTQLRRLESKKLQDWLQRYKLGELWKMGELGGTRW